MQALLDSLQILHLKRKQNKKDVTEFFSGVCFLPQRILFNQKEEPEVLLYLETDLNKTLVGSQ